LLAVCNCLFSIFATALHIWRLSPPSTTWGCAMPCHCDKGPPKMGQKECGHEQIWCTLMVLSGRTEEENRNLKQYSPSSLSDLNPRFIKYKAVLWLQDAVWQCSSAEIP
jgi:hypothetical protein